MIINSLLDQDMYKLSMGAVFLHRFSDSWGRYVFKCRNQGIIWKDEMLADINRELDHLSTLTFTGDEIEYLGGIRYMKKGYIEFLRMFRLDRKYVRAWKESTGELRVEAEGPIFLVSMFEIFVLAIVNEVYFRDAFAAADKDSGSARLEEKIIIAREAGLRFSDFGTRRRISAAWQEKVVERLADALPRDLFTGTSNVFLAMKYGITPIGTMAHEYIQLPQAIDEVTLASSQKYALQLWVDEYRGDLGYALSDTLGFDKFLRDFDRYFAKLYDGVRHDSGDPFAWGHRMIDHYRSFGIEPLTKHLIFSDGLDFPLAARLHREFSPEIGVGFGIGTNLTNDFPGIVPLQIVMKLVEANGRPVAKISENPGKTMCEDQNFLSYLKEVIKK